LGGGWGMLPRGGGLWWGGSEGEAVGSEGGSSVEAASDVERALLLSSLLRTTLQ
jgi:hypothetical protein